MKFPFSSVGRTRMSILMALSLGAAMSTFCKNTSSLEIALCVAPIAADSALRKLVLPELFSPISTVSGLSSTSTNRRQR